MAEHSTKSAEGKQEIHLGVMITPEFNSDFEQLRRKVKIADKTHGRKLKKWSRSAFARYLMELGAKNFASNDRNISHGASNE